MKREDIVKEIRGIEISSKLMASEVFAGEYHSYFKGNGIEWDGIRRYTEGDDVKRIDWKVSARQRKTFVKEFTETRELAIYIAVDVSKSIGDMKYKKEIAKIIGTLGLGANKNRDRVGCFFFSDKLEAIMPLKKGRKHTLAIIDKYLTLEDTSPKTNLSGVFSNINKLIKKRSILFIISDFLDEDYEEQLKLLKLSHDLIEVSVRDGKIKKLPKGAFFFLKDSEEETREIIDTTLQGKNLTSSKKNNGIEVDISKDYIKEFIKFFKRRRR